MRTLLSQFCEAFDANVRPLLDPIGEAAGVLNGARAQDPPGQTASQPGSQPGGDTASAGPFTAPFAEPAAEPSAEPSGGPSSGDSQALQDHDLPEVRAELLDLQHQIQGLVDKVAEQQAYVLLFGPLKSGKSTLMNALAGAYVSEVSSLPAYPCMVYLSHAAERNFYVSRYNGETERFTDPSALYGHISRAHGELAARLRTAESEGRQFDPALHFPDAIRKVDVRIPAGNLSKSGAVLVDTPGLYSRMKFGYDRMTRDFRDSASCAIFVVKSDNLFLEQVFEEFEDLLDLFSRIFLVVNLDTTKSDLSPDGTLVPSLEQEDPLRIIDAFENLAMSQPLKDAADEGRLKIYPVDLLRAASQRLREGERDEPHARGQANFDAFLTDLTEYLNSTDYLVAFLGDSLRRAEGLLDDLDDLVEHESVAALRAHAGALDTERQDLSRRRHSVHRLEAFDWRASFEELDEKLSPSIRSRAKASSIETERELDKVVEAWFKTDASFESLVKDDLEPRFSRYEAQLAEFVAQTLEEEVKPGTAGLLLPSEIGADLHSARLDMNLIGDESLQAMEKQLALGHVRAPLTVEKVPVRKSLFDWLLLRTRASCAKRLFGDTGNPAARIPVEKKQARLGDEAKAAIRRELDLYKGRFFHETVQRSHRHLIGRYADAAVHAMKTQLKERDVALESEIQTVVDRLVRHRKILSHFAALRTETARARGGVEQLGLTYGQTEPEKLIQPAPAGQLPTMPTKTVLLPAPLIPHVATSQVPDGGEDGGEDELENETAAREVAGTDSVLDE